MTYSHQKTVLIVTGPTATGKTDIAIELARHWDTSIISADSRQCYRELVIGAAQPDTAQLAQVPHYNIGRYSVTESVSVADFEQYALSVLHQLFQERDVAIVCGGTGLYIRALAHGLDEMPHVPAHINTEVSKEYDEKGLVWLQQEVQRLDPEFYKTAEIQNPARLLRALSFFRTTGTSIRTFQTTAIKPRPFRIVKCGLDLPREYLYARINSRVGKMMDQGLLAEVQGLYPLRHLPALKTVGYAELFEYLEGNTSLEEAVDKIKQHTRNYAKRQLTWFRKEQDLIWLPAGNTETVKDIIERV